jgi:hypothetical protein
MSKTLLSASSLKSLVVLLSMLAAARTWCAESAPDARPVIRQSEQSFAHALGEVSSAPHYVQIWLAENPSEPGQLTCVFGGALNLAIRREMHIEASWDGIVQAKEIALKNRERRFHFTQPDALAAVKPTFSEADLDAARARLAPLSNDQIRAGLRFSPWGALHKEYTNERDLATAACALIERGMSPGRSDRVHALYVDD